MLPYVKLLGEDTYFATIIDAYSAALSGTIATFQATARLFAGDLNLGKNVALTIKGGYDDEFSSNPGITTVNGVLSVGSGSLTV